LPIVLGALYLVLRTLFSRFYTNVRKDAPIGNLQSKIKNDLAGLTRLELAISASTVQRFDPTKLQPREYCRFLIADWFLSSKAINKKHKASSTKHQVESTKYKVQSPVQSTKPKARSTKH
jgi:hypothetical protein